MNTDDWINQLATNVQPVPRRVGEQRLGRALTLGGLSSLALLWWSYGPRPDLDSAMALPAFWAKLLLPMAVGLAAVPWVFHLLHPGAREGAGRWWSLTPVAGLWGWAAWVWWGTEPPLRMALLWGTTWQVCVVSILVTAFPLAVALFWAARGLAPTQPIRTGAAIGWTAGGLGAAVYALHCPEMAAPFLAVWYVLGMAACAAAGAVVGHKVLRW